MSYNSEHVQSQVILQTHIQTHIWYKTETCKGASNLQLIWRVEVQVTAKRHIGYNIGRW